MSTEEVATTFSGSFSLHSGAPLQAHWKGEEVH